MKGRTKTNGITKCFAEKTNLDMFVLLVYLREKMLWKHTLFPQNYVC